MKLSDPLKFPALKLPVMLCAKPLCAVLLAAYSAFKPMMLSVYERVSICLKHLIMLFAVTTRFVLSATNYATRMLKVVLLVFGMAPKKHKVFNSIVAFNAVNVVNKLMAFKLSAKVIFHNNSVFEHVSGLSSGYPNQNVTVRVCEPPTTPVWAKLRMLRILFLSAFHAHSKAVWRRYGVIFVNRTSAVRAWDFVFSVWVHLVLKLKHFLFQVKQNAC